MTQEQKDELKDTIYQEGFDYAFIHYSDFKEVEDPMFHKLRERYRQARKELADYIGSDQ